MIFTLVLWWDCSDSDSDSDIIADDSDVSFSDDNPDYINYQVSIGLILYKQWTEKVAEGTSIIESTSNKIFLYM